MLTTVHSVPFDKCPLGAVDCDRRPSCTGWPYQMVPVKVDGKWFKSWVPHAKIAANGDPTCFRRRAVEGGE